MKIKDKIQLVKNKWIRFKSAWKGEIQLDPPPKLFLMGCRFGIVVNKKVLPHDIIIVCHPTRRHEVVNAFHDATEKFDPRLKGRVQTTNSRE